MRKLCRVAAVLGAAILAMAQTGAPPAFEVASIKVHAEGARSGSFPTPGRLTVGNRTLKGFITDYYHYKQFQVVGTDGWMDSIAWDIDAKASGPANFREMQEMLKTLLADRFHLRFHRETREIPTYWLMVAKGGPKLKAPDPNDKHPGGIANRPHSLQGWKESIGMLVGFLGAELDKPILDKTGLDGVYDFKLEWSEDIRSPDAGEQPADLSKPPLFVALQEQAGLKLEVHPGPVEFFVIDHAEKPEVN